MRSGLPVLSGELTKKAPLGFGGARRSLGAAIVGQHTSRTATPSGSPLFIARCRRMLIDQNYPERQATVNGRAIRRTAGFGASSSLPPVPAKVASPNQKRPLRLDGGNWSSCAEPAIGRRSWRRLGKPALRVFGARARRGQARMRMLTGDSASETVALGGRRRWWPQRRTRACVQVCTSPIRGHRRRDRPQDTPEP